MQLLDLGLMVTVNADDPSYFGGYLNDNFNALIEHLPITQQALMQLVSNSFQASFLPEDSKLMWIKKLHENTLS